MAFQEGENDIAVDLIGKALAMRPDYAEAHNNLGNALRELGKVDDARITVPKRPKTPSFEQNPAQAPIWGTAPIDNCDPTKHSGKFTR